MSVIFFLIIYNTDWLQVVTLGGLIAGVGILSCWSVLCAEVLKKLNRWLTVLLLMAGIAGFIKLLTVILPGYDLNIGTGFISCIILFSAVTVMQNRYLEGMKE